MYRINKRLILLLVLALIANVLAGCSNKKVAPEGVGQDFYDDMIESLEKLEKYKGDKTKNGYDVVEEYYNNKTWLSSQEKDIIIAIEELYSWVWYYYEGTDPNVYIIRDMINTVAELMAIEIDIDKIIVEI